MKYIVALDQGTTSSRAIVFDENGGIASVHAEEFKQIFPKPGWVEHDPEDIWFSQLTALKLAVQKSGIDTADIKAIGITNQRETTLIWDRKTGKPLMNAIVWQCRRTAPIVKQLEEDGVTGFIKQRTGLIPDAYFSATKLKWMLDADTGIKQAAIKGEACFGTVDSFLAYRLTGRHVTDATNASRTILYNIYTQSWDDELLKLFDIPAGMLPEVVDTSSVIGMLDKSILGREIPVAALVGDQHAALFGQGCHEAGEAKNTYGTGCFLLMNTGKTPISTQSLLTTTAWRIAGKTTYALEGSVFVGGAVIKWLRDELGLISTAAETNEIAKSVSDAGGVYIVPAFTGLGAPYWDMYARGTIVGLTRGSGKAQLVRAALEAIAYQSFDVLEAMENESQVKMQSLKVDGGASNNDFLMQFQADILGVNVLRPQITETTALGAAMLAGLAVGMWNEENIKNMWKLQTQFKPQMEYKAKQALINGWQKAIDRAKNWA